MIIDTSAWVDYSRRAEGAVGDAIEAALDAGTAMTLDVVRLELLVGLPLPARQAMSGVLAGCVFVQQENFFDVEAAIDLYQRCRRGGETVRSPNHCLIAAVAVRVGAPVLHADRDFDVIARHTALTAVRG